MNYRRQGKIKIIFGGVLILAGLLGLIFFDAINSNQFLGGEHGLLRIFLNGGPYGLAAILSAPGIIIVVKGFFDYDRGTNN